MIRLFAVVAIAVSCAACFRTTYTNLAPPPAQAVAAADAEVEAPGSWQHFFVWGWVPGEHWINAAGACGGAEHVKRIETRQTFLQGLIEQLASYYVNIYSPYTGAVICDGPPPPK